MIKSKYTLALCHGGVSPTDRCQLAQVLPGPAILRGQQNLDTQELKLIHPHKRVLAGVYIYKQVIFTYLTFTFVTFPSPFSLSTPFLHHSLEKLPTKTIEVTKPCIISWQISESVEELKSPVMTVGQFLPFIQLSRSTSEQNINQMRTKLSIFIKYTLLLQASIILLTLIHLHGRSLQLVEY